MTAAGGLDAAVGEQRRPLHRAVDAWNRWWFTPRSIAPLVPLRIVLGLLVALWGVSLVADARAFLGPDGVLPVVPDVRIRMGLLQLWRTDTAAVLVAAACIPAGLAVALGWRTRATTILAFLLLLSVSRRNAWILNSGDALLRHALLFLAMTPAGAAWSLDQRRTDRANAFVHFPRAAPWGLRLLQLQLSFVYLFSTISKLLGEPWLRGTALADAWRIGDIARFGVPMWLYDSAFAIALFTYATLVIEAALAFLLWNRRLRPYVALAGVLLHIGIEITMSVGFFSLVSVTLYLAFVEPSTVERWLATVRRRWTARRTARRTARPIAARPPTAP